MTIEQEFHFATQLHQSGRLPEARAAYEKLLGRAPNHADCLHYLGILKCQMGQSDVGAELITKAIRLKPEVAVFHNNLGTALKNCGKLAEAAIAYRRSIELQPNDPLAFSNLGNVLRDLGQPGDAAEACRRAIALKPDYGEAHNNLGNALKDLGLVDDAVTAYHRATQLLPNWAEIHNNLGSGLTGLGRFDDALMSLRRSLELNPASATAKLNLGIVMGRLGKHAEAIAAYREAIGLSPDLAEVHGNLGRSLLSLGEADEAITACRRSIELMPDVADSYITLGLALRSRRKIVESSLAYESAIRLNPDCAEAHWNLALNHLLMGDFEKGWAEYEWRCKAFTPRNSFTQPQWRGEELNGRRILLHAEQGFGDTLQFVRYAPMVAARGGTVLLQCQQELAGLLTGMPGVSQVIADRDPLPPFDLHCPLMSLPLALSTHMESIPSTIPYLVCDPPRLEKWRSRLDPSDGKIRVGIAWAGRPEFPSDRTRSLHLSSLQPLADMQGIRFYSLQKGSPAEQLKSSPQGMDIIDLGNEIHDFADTAAVMSHMDLIISTDTSVPHLAGALGRPVWLMLQFVPDWRWLLDRDDSPWYPTMRLFRQTIAGDWAETIQRVVDALREFRCS